MKITRITMPKNFLDRGLQEININRLGDTVIIAGKNGAGKTRLLNLVYECVNRDIKTKNEIASINGQVKSYEQSIKNSPTS